MFPALRVVSITATRAAAIAELAADVIDQFDQLPYERLRDGMYVAATSEAELVADPFGAIWRPAYAPRDARHAWCDDGPSVLADPRSGGSAAPEEDFMPRRHFGQPSETFRGHRASAGSHVARGGTVLLRMGSRNAAAKAWPTANDWDSPSSAASSL